MRHGAPPTAARTLGIRFGVSLLASFVLLAVAVTAVNWQLDAKVAGIDRVDVTVDTTPRDAQAGNYLIVGSDSREFVDGDPDALESFGDVGGDRGDSIMIAHVEPEHRELFVVSIPRDTVVERSSGARSKITEVFGDGPQALIDVIAENFDVPITHFLNVDFAGFDRVVDLVGPVPVHFNRPARDTMSGLYVPESGCVELDGERALQYVRSRYYEEQVYGNWVTDPTSDLGRIQRQQAFLRQLGVLARDEVYSSPLEVPGIVDAVLDTLRVDQDFGRDQILGFVDRFRDVDPYDPTAVEMVTLPTVRGPLGSSLGDHQILEEPAAEEVLARLRSFGDGAPVPTTSTTGAPEPEGTPGEVAPDDAEDPTADERVPAGEPEATVGADDDPDLSGLVLPDAIYRGPDQPAVPHCT